MNSNYLKLQFVLPFRKRLTGSDSKVTSTESLASHASEPTSFPTQNSLNNNASNPRQNNYFTNKVAIVTGSESGIGRETARLLAQKGAHVVLNGIRAERLAQTEAEFHKQGLSVVSCLADITNFQDCERLVQTAIDTFGRLDILITNASVSMRAYFADTHPDVFRRILDNNVYGAVYPLQAALPHLCQNRGSVTFISSISAINGMPSGSAYCAGKAALVNLAHTIRLELHHTGLHVGVVHIGFTKNDPDKHVFDATGQAVPIAYRSTNMQMSQQTVAKAILSHIRRRRSTTILSPLGQLIYLSTRFFPNLGERIVRWTMRRWRKFYE